MAYAPVTYKEEQLKKAKKYYAPVTYVEAAAVSQAYVGPQPKKKPPPIARKGGWAPPPKLLPPEVREWTSGLYEEYPRERYRIEAKRADEGWKALIYERPEYLLGEWRKGILEQYPSDKYRIEWTSEGASIYEIKKLMIGTLPKKPPGYMYVYPSETGAFHGPGAQVYLVPEKAYKEYKEWREQPPYYEKSPERPKLSLFIEEMFVAPYEGKPRTVRALERFKKITEELGKFKVISEPALWKYGVYEEKPLVKLAQPLLFAAGVVAPVESPFRPEVATPIGAIFSEEQRRELVELGPWYVAGTLVGEYIVGVGVAKGLGKLWGGVKRVTPQFIKEPIYQTFKFGRPAKWAYQAKLWRTEHLPLYRTSRVDIWLAKHFQWYYAKTGGIAPGEVAIPKPISGFVGGEAIPRLSIPQLKGFSLAWELHQAPRTGGVWLGKYLMEPTKRKVLPHMFISVSKGFVAGPAYLKEYRFERVKPETTLTPLVSQTQLTRMGIYPYVPKIATATGRKTLAKFVATVATTTLLRLPQRPKRKKAVWQPSFALERIKYSPLEISRLEPKKKEKLVPVLKFKFDLGQVQKIISKQIQEYEQKVKPTQIWPTPPPTPTPTPAPFRLVWPRLVGGRARAVRATSLFGKWFRREHPVVTAKKMAKTFGLSIPTRRKVKREKRKRKPKKGRR